MIGPRSATPATLATILLVLLEISVVTALAATARVRRENRQQIIRDNRRLVTDMGFTDLALSTGTSYTRHPSQADIFAPHNTHPAAIEHFSAGSIVPPPFFATGFPMTGHEVDP